MVCGKIQSVNVALQAENQVIEIDYNKVYCPALGRRSKRFTVNPEYFVFILFSYISYTAASVRK